MARTRFFRKIQQLIRVAEHCARTDEPAAEALQRLHDQAAQQPRRHVLRAAAGLGLAATLPLRAAPGAGGTDVAVVGAGFAGLHAATLLAGKGARAQVFEAGDRVGGRVWSLRGFFPGQVAERGAEPIDTTHSTLRGLAGAYDLTIHDSGASPPSMKARE